MNLAEFKKVTKSFAEELFVRTTVMSDEKILSRRQTGFHKRNLECTIFNENYSVPIQKSELENAALVIEVNTQESVSGLNSEIGRCCVGSLMYASGNYLMHWNDVLVYRGSNITRTHNLY